MAHVCSDLTAQLEQDALMIDTGRTTKVNAGVYGIG